MQPRASGAWPSAQRACPYSVRRTDEAATAAEEEFARRALQLRWFNSRKVTLNPQPYQWVPRTPLPSLGLQTYEITPFGALGASETYEIIPFP